jgi:DNA mismatch repair protein MSH6
VLDDLSRRLRCRSLFSTHYHLLTKEFEGNRQIALYHMGCLANKETYVSLKLPLQPFTLTTAPHHTTNRKEVIFLYKFTEGVCPKSYGMNVARAAVRSLLGPEQAITVCDD